MQKAENSDEESDHEEKKAALMDDKDPDEFDIDERNFKDFL